MLKLALEFNYLLTFLKTLFTNFSSTKNEYIFYNL